MSNDGSGYHARVSPWAAGLACRCPRCGKGPLFKGFLGLQDRCSICGLDYSKADAGDGPAVFLIFILGFTVVPIVILIELLYQPPIWLHAIIGAVLILGGALALLRPMKALMIALQFRHKASDSGNESYD
jgi:uncharacterized protein (DUF983 family)